MPEEPQPIDAVPAGWHPDPMGAPHLRWWDGQRWTEHVAPIPDATPAAAPAGEAADPGAHPDAPSSQYAPVPQQPAAPRQKVMTPATWAVLAATVLVVGGAGGAMAWGASSAQAEITSAAPDTLDGFLRTASTGDASWTEYVTPEAAAVASAPLVRGDAAAAESIGLSVAYEAGPLRYGHGYHADATDPEGADTAMSIVDFTYTFTVDGSEQTAVTSQAVWLSRAFYYGDDRASAAKSGRSPSKVGPWRVAGLSAVSADVVDDPNPHHETTYTATDDTTADCSSAHGVLEQLSEVARVRNFFGAVCLSGGDRTTIGADVDLAAIGAQFPAVTDVTELPDMLGLGEDQNDRVPAPLSEHRLTIGGEDYVFVFAAVGHGGLLVPEGGVRLISLQKAAS